ncbi:MAG: Rieske 2Fe-2S domain-containing protein [Nitrospira sp.]|nr:Rieske 2Fe-2S domain-containing protein [Nitrospira sp.]
MEGFHKVAQLDELSPGQSKIVTVNARAIALFNVGGTFYAIHNSCPHEGGPLIEGRLKGFVVACPWHDLAFDIRNGQGMLRWRPPGPWVWSSLTDRGLAGKG